MFGEVGGGAAQDQNGSGPNLIAFLEFVQRVDGLAVDLRREPFGRRKHRPTGGFNHLVGEGLDGNIQSVRQRLKAGACALAIAVGNVANNRQGIGGRGQASAENQRRAFPVRADGQAAVSQPDSAVPAHADRKGLQGADQGPVGADGDTVRIEHRRAADQDRQVGSGAADVHHDRVFVPRGHGNGPHDARRRSGEDGLGRIVDRGLQFHVAAVGLEQAQRQAQTLSGQAVQHGIEKSFVERVDGRVQVGGGDTAGKIQAAGNAVAQEDFIEAIPHQFTDADFVGGVADREFPHHPHLPDAVLSEALGRRPDLLRPDRLRLAAAVVDGALHADVVRIGAKMLGIDPGAGRHDHPHGRDLVLDDGVGGQCGAEYDAPDGAGIHAFRDRIQSLENRAEEIRRIRGDFDLPPQTGMVQQNDIRVGTPDIQPDDHVDHHPSQFLNGNRSPCQPGRPFEEPAFIRVARASTPGGTRRQQRQATWPSKKKCSTVQVSPA